MTMQVTNELRQLYRLLVARQVVQQLEVEEQVKQAIIQSISQRAEKIRTVEERRGLLA